MHKARNSMLYRSYQCCLKVPATASVLTESDESLSRSESLHSSPVLTHCWRREQVLEHSPLVASQVKVSTKTRWLLTLYPMKVWATRTGLPSNANYCSLRDSYPYVTFNQSAMPQNLQTCGFRCSVWSASTCTTLFNLQNIVEHFVNYIFWLRTVSSSWLGNYHVHTRSARRIHVISST